ncbi:MAG: ferredoxin reductase [Nevskiales bacterium]
MTSPSPRNNLLSTGLRRVLSSRVVATLATPHSVDRYLELFDPTWSLHEVRAEVTGVRHSTADSVTLTLRPNGNWQGFRAGQFARLSVEINGVRRTRCFSPANSVHARDGLLELTMKVNPQGQLTKYLSTSAKVGAVVGLSQADGSFALPAQRPDRILLISGGSGITPVLSMLRTLCDEGHKGRITFLHYANSVADAIYAGELVEIAARQPNVELIRAFAQPDQGGELQGLFNREHLLKAAPDYADAQTFLCGPPGMMKAVQQVFADEGLSDRLHLEHFGAPAAPAAVAAGDAQGEIRFIRSERYVANDGRSLLDQAESLGLKPESGCRMGICKSCTCRKTSGRVRDMRNGQISDAGEEDIQICISVPVDTVTLDI